MANIEMRTDAEASLASSVERQPPIRRYSQDMILAGLIALDAVAIVACGLIVDSWVVHREIIWSDFASAAVIAFIFYTFVFNSLGSYRSLGDINIAARCSRAAFAWIAAMLVLVAAAFMLKVGDHYSRIGASVFAFVGLITIVVENAIAARLINMRLKLGQITFARIQTICLVADSNRTHLQWSPPLGFHRVRDYRLNVSCEGYKTQCRELRDTLRQEIVAGQCDQIVIAADWTQRENIEALLRSLGPLPAPILMLADPSLTAMYQQRRVSFGTHVGFELQSAPLGRVDRAFKRAMDLVVAAVALIILSPILLLAAIAVCFDSGFPILFRQDRRGYGGVPFKILKFRSMTVAENGAEVRQAERGDSRVTNIGRLLRRTSIDELPQLFNVLKGDMSIVGPRPHARAHDDHYDRIIERYAFRHHVKPGITGWAQVHGARGATETPGAMQTRIEYDLWYINHWSIWLDVRIILRTAFKIIADDNAY